MEELAGTAQVALIASDRDVHFQGSLDESRGCQIVDALEIHETVIDRSLGNQKTDAQTRHQDLRKRADVDDATARVERLESRLGAPLVSQIAHKIIFQDGNV